MVVVHSPLIIQVGIGADFSLCEQDSMQQTVEYQGNGMDGFLIVL